MKRKVDPEKLSHEEEEDLLNSLNAFDDWLVTKGITQTKASVQQVDFPFADEDWTMIVETDGSVSFNTFVKKKCSYNYYKSIVLHEFFHLVVQKIPHKDDAVKIKDDYGGIMMNLIDIQADFFTALFYREAYGTTLVQYLLLYYEGGKVFADKWIRISKLERFIGTLLSITKMFCNTPDKRDDVDFTDLYLPCVAPLSTEENLHVLVVKKKHIYFDSIVANNKDFLNIKDSYTNINNTSFKEYVIKITEFTFKALKIDMADEIKKEIEALTI